jgi:hypothetical protein
MVAPVSSRPVDGDETSVVDGAAVDRSCGRCTTIRAALSEESTLWRRRRQLLDHELTGVTGQAATTCPIDPLEVILSRFPTIAAAHPRGAG